MFLSKFKVLSPAARSDVDDSSTLAFSNFIPTQNFGIFSSLAMVAALLAAMTILPASLLVLKPFGRIPVREEPPPAAEPEA